LRKIQLFDHDPIKFLINLVLGSVGIAKLPLIGDCQIHVVISITLYKNRAACFDLKAWSLVLAGLVITRSTREDDAFSPAF
jgi:hypothetical protein